MSWVQGRSVFGLIQRGRSGGLGQCPLSRAAALGGTRHAHSAGGAHSGSAFERWRILSAVGAVPVLLYGVWLFWEPHEHGEPPPPYPYLRRRSREPAFPWGNHELLGAPWDREPHAHSEAE